MAFVVGLGRNLQMIQRCFTCLGLESSLIGRVICVMVSLDIRRGAKNFCRGGGKKGLVASIGVDATCHSSYKRDKFVVCSTSTHRYASYHSSQRHLLVNWSSLAGEGTVDHTLSFPFQSYHLALFAFANVP